MKYIAAFTLFVGFTATTFAQNITSVTPSSAERGTIALPVSISGSGTNFSSATSTVVEIAQGTSTLVTSAVNVVSGALVDLSVTVSNLDATGDYTVRVYDQVVGGMVELLNGFTVLSNSNPPSVVNTTPELAAVGQLLPVTITTQNANFLQATNTAMYLTVQGTSTIIYPVGGTEQVLTDNNIRAYFDFGAITYGAGTVINAHAWNSFDGSFDDMGAIVLTASTSLYGTLNYGGTYDGVVELYQQNQGVTPNTYSLVATSTVGAGNTYDFQGVPEATYLIRSVPIGVTDVVATYYPSNIAWQSATHVTTDTSGPAGPFDITPVPSLLILTNGISVNGNIGWGPNGFVNKTSAVVNAEDVEVFLRDTVNNYYSQDVTDANGIYGFTGIPDGTYDIIINKPGYEQISTYTFVVDNNAVNLTDMDFLIEDGQISAVNSLGLTKLDASKLNVYPNPVGDELMIALPEGIGNVEIMIHDAVGQQVWQRNVPAGMTMMKVDVGALPAGVYVISAVNENGKFESRLVKD